MFSKSHLISKGLFAILNSSKKCMKQFDHITVRQKKTNLFVRFLEESEDTEKSFRNYLTFICLFSLDHQNCHRLLTPVVNPGINNLGTQNW